MADTKIRDMVDALAEDTSPDLQADFVMTNDTSASLQKKVKPWRYGRGAKGADIASASTVNLDSATGDLVDVTGTTTITAITLAEGRHATVRFTGILTLTNGASLVLPGAANITTAAGDYAIFRGYATGVVRCVVYIRAASLPATQSGTETLSAKKISLNAALGTDDTYEGIQIVGKNAAGTLAQWDTVYLTSAGKWGTADAETASTMPARGMAVAAGTLDNPLTVLTYGTVRNDAWAWTVGGVIYINGGGGLTQSAPAGSGDTVQKVGYAISADIAFVDFNSTVTEIP